MIRSLIVLLLLVLIATIVLHLAGCDDRAAQVAREAADRQAEQNRQMAELQQEVAAGSKSLVEADAAARQEMLAAHRDLHEERTVLDGGWNDLEAQRQKIARDRRAGELIVAIGKALLGVLVVVLVLALCREVLAGAQQAEAADVELQELLVEELASQQLRPPPAAKPPAITQQDAQAPVPDD